MRSKVILIPALLLTILLLSFINKNQIGQCYISFKTATGLIAASPDRLPETSPKSRVVKTEHGELEVTRVDGYRILYNNDKKAPFVNLKVELSKDGSYESDKTNLVAHLKYLNAHSKDMEGKNLIELEFNGHKVYGISRATIEADSTLGTFMMFPGNRVTVYFYFNNIKPEFRNFESVEEYKDLRDQFMNEYTKFLATCKDK